MTKFLNTALTEADFIRDYWQKKPLLIRQAFPDFKSPLSPEELAGLACEIEIESRLIQEHGDTPWQVRSGPFNEDDFAELPASHWTLLVQDVDKHAAELGVGDLFDPLWFIPAWRRDDVMVSYAVDGGTVGPHTDNYDVFLLQGLGKRRWQIGNQPIQQAVLLPDLSLQILAEFAPDEEWVLAPGDMLYLPPSFAHHGVAEGDCMTYSLGFRAPSQLDLLDAVVNGLSEVELGNTRYLDALLDTTDAAQPAEIDAAVVENIQTMLHAAVDAAAPHLASWIGRQVTEPKSTLLPLLQPAETAEDAASLAQKFAEGGVLLKSPYYRFAWTQSEKGGTLFVAGEAYSVQSDVLAFLPLLCDVMEITPQYWQEMVPHDEIVALLQSLIAEGAWYWLAE